MTDHTSISRRAMLAGAGALSATGALGAPAKAQERKRGGTLRLGLAGGGNADLLDPARITDVFQSVVGYQARNTLVELLPNLEPGPELAESWESKDATTWIFNLRKGVEFHNGKTFTSEDAIFSLNHHREPSRASLAAGFVRQIEDIKADGPNRMIVKLKGPNADFPVVLSEYRLMVMSSDTKDFNTNTNGTGGYVV
ncbi:MAG: ABC transporter substrate-binding protein, partial [Pseudorhodoplanes sp.]